MILIVVHSTSNRRIYFGRVMTCIEPGDSKCVNWKSTINLSVEQDFYQYHCFPESTYVL